MKHIFWLFEDDAQWARVIIVALVIVGVVFWGVNALGLSWDFDI